MPTYEGENMDVIKEPVLESNEKKLILVVHDESIFQANDVSKGWVEEGKTILRKKGEGRSLMVSDMYCECHGRLQDEFGETRVLWNVGKNYDGYWTNKDLVKNLKEKAIPIFERLHPGCKAVFMLDNSQNHNAFPPDALLASELNLSDGGKNTPILRATSFLDKEGEIVHQPMQDSSKLPKGIRRILEERKLWRAGLLLDCPGGCSKEGGCCAENLGFSA